MRAIAAALAALGAAAALPAASSPQSPTRKCAGFVESPAFSPNGEWVAYVRSQPTGPPPECSETRVLQVIRAAEPSLRRTLARNVVYWQWSPRRDQLAVVSGQDDPQKRRLRLVRPRGSARTIAASYFYHRWSPGGRFIAFTTAKGDLRVVRARGGRIRTITRGTIWDWSPGGRRIVYQMPGYALRTVRADGTDDRFLAEGTRADWSPDGRWIAFHDRSSMYVVRPDGSNRRELDPGWEYPYFLWSPQGRKATLHQPSFIESDGRTVVADADTGEARSLGGGAPLWSPTGRRIAISRVWDEPGVELVRPDGTHRIRVASGPLVAYSWSRTGRRLLIVDREAIYLARSTGAGFREVAEGRDPSWAPDGRRFAFIGESPCGVFLRDLRGHPTRRLARCS